jgi:hypothetical protein
MMVPIGGGWLRCGYGQAASCHAAESSQQGAFLERIVTRGGAEGTGWGRHESKELSTRLTTPEPERLLLAG